MTDQTSATPSGVDNTPATFEAGSDDLTQYLAGVLGEEEPKEKPAASEAESSRTDSPVPAGQELDAKPADSEELYTVKIDGEERKVTRDELTRNYQSIQAANKRFEEAAQLRQQYEAQQSAVQQERQQLAQALQAFQQQIQATIQPPDPKLLDSDPVEFLRQQQSYNAKVQQWQQAQAAQAHLTQQQQAERAQREQAYLAEQSAKLAQAIPEWTDSAKAQAEKQALREYLQKTGFADHEVASVVDHRQVVLARKAMLFDQLVAARDSAAKQVKNLPPARVERPGANRDQGGRFSAQNLPASMNIDQAAHALMGLFGGE